MLAQLLWQRASCLQRLPYFTPRVTLCQCNIEQLKHQFICGCDIKGAVTVAFSNCFNLAVVVDRAQCSAVHVCRCPTDSALIITTLHAVILLTYVCTDTYTICLHCCCFSILMAQRWSGLRQLDVTDLDLLLHCVYNHSATLTSGIYLCSIVTHHCTEVSALLTL
jgi:hypothetical protein